MRYIERMRRQRPHVKTILVLIILAAMAGCTRQSREAAAPGKPEKALPAEGNRGGTLHLAGREDLRSLDPAVEYNVLSNVFMRVLYNGLVDYDDGTEIVPDIAEKWEVGPDGKSYRFTLKKGVKFLNGREVTAEDVRYTFERVLDPKTMSPGSRYYQCLEGAEDFVKGKAAHVSGIEVEGPYQLTFKLKAPVPYFLNLLAMNFGFVVPKEEVARYGKNFGRHPHGTGPFKLEEWVPGQRIVLARNPAYFRPEWPKADQIEYLPEVQASLAVMKLERGELDMFDGLPSADYVRLSRDPAWKGRLVSAAAASTIFLQLNCEMAPFTRLKVRQALAYAVDRDRIIQLLNGRGQAARGMLPPSVPGYNENLKGYPFDPGKAKSLLKEAGYPDGIDIEIWTLSDEATVKTYQAVQSDLTRAGIRAKIKPVTFNALLDATGRPGQVAIYGSGWTQDFPDPMNFLEVNFHSRQIAPVDSNNRSYYRSREVDALLDKAARMPSGPERWAVYRQVEEKIVADAPCVFLYHPITVTALNPRVKGYRYHPVWIARYDRIAVQ
ncbi:MAG: ABC transporter substrate-binding protein [Armatimonadetes bacterium]|nr:ABC transporter substrate-binding protein [Armatimonadota bacterium]